MGEAENPAVMSKATARNTPRAPGSPLRVAPCPFGFRNQSQQRMILTRPKLLFALVPDFHLDMHSSAVGCIVSDTDGQRHPRGIVGQTRIPLGEEEEERGGCMWCDV